MRLEAAVQSVLECMQFGVAPVQLSKGLHAVGTGLAHTHMYCWHGWELATLHVKALVPFCCACNQSSAVDAEAVSTRLINTRNGCRRRSSTWWLRHLHAHCVLGCLAASFLPTNTLVALHSNAAGEEAPGGAGGFSSAPHTLHARLLHSQPQTPHLLCALLLQEKKPNLVGQEVFTQRATHLAYERRADKIAPDLAAYEAAKAAAPDRALALDPMEYGKGHQVGFCGGRV